MHNERWMASIRGTTRTQKEITLCSNLPVSKTDTHFDGHQPVAFKIITSS